jgi:hypothetical protein
MSVAQQIEDIQSPQKIVVRTKTSRKMSSKLNLLGGKPSHSMLLPTNMVTSTGKKMATDPISIIKNAMAGILENGPVSTQETGKC